MKEERDTGEELIQQSRFKANIAPIHSESARYDITGTKK